MQAIEMNNYFLVKIGSFPFNTVLLTEGTAVPSKLLSQKARKRNYLFTAT